MPRPSQTQTGTAGKKRDNWSHVPGRHRRRLTKHRPTCKKQPSSAQGTFIPKHTLTWAHTATEGEREGKRRERGESQERKKDTHTDIQQRHRNTHPRQPLRLQGSALRENDNRVREQPMGLLQACPGDQKGRELRGDSPAHRLGRPEAGIPRCFPGTPPEVSSSWCALRDSRHPETIPLHPLETSGWSLDTYVLLRMGPALRHLTNASPGGRWRSP